MSESTPTDPDGKRSLRRLGILSRLLAMLKPHRLRFWMATVALLLGSGLILVYPQAVRQAVDLGIKSGKEDELNRVVLLVVVLFSVSGVLVWVRHYLMSWLGERVVADLRRLVFDRLLRLPLSWFHERRTGELVGRLASDVTVVEGVVGSELSIALRNIVQLIGGIVVLFIENAYLTAMMLLVVPPLVVGVVMFGRVIRRMSRAVQDRLAVASAQVQESVGAVQTVQSFVREDDELDRYTGDVESAFQEALRLSRWRASFFSVVSVAGYFAIAAIIYIGGLEVMNGNISAGDLMAFLLYTVIVAGALGSVAALWGNLQRAAGATERLFGIIDTVPDIRDPALPTELADGAGAFEFDAVHFSYPSRPDKVVLDGIELEVAAGEVVALVGPSGSGKTTIGALLQRFYDVDGGVIRFEGTDVSELRLAELRASIAVVAQEPVLFSGTIADNIKYGRPDATTDDIEAAARDANAHHFIEQFPDGYRTTVGERGVKLSGGQKQRIAIARAIVADARVLILDEATSNLDSESEALVQEALARLMRRRTTLVIAHRLSTVRDADRIVVLDGGVVAESGTHDELMASSGLYRRLVERQLSASETPQQGEVA